jgi:hypothetical protein
VFFRGEYAGTSNYYSILADYRIPEDIRIAGAFVMLNSIAKYGMAHAWMPYNWRKSVNDTTGNYSIANNRKILTYIGFGITLGVASSTSLPADFRLSNTTTGDIKLIARRHWDLNNITDTASVDSVNLDASQIIPVFEVADKASFEMADKRNVPYIGVQFSERERNRYLYMELDSTGNAIGWQNLPVPNNAVPSTKDEAQREAMAWYHVGLPVYGVFNSCYNSMPVSVGGEMVSYKYPIQFFNDTQIDSGITNGNRAVIVPLPALDGDTMPADPLDLLLKPTKIALTNFPLRSLSVFHNPIWFSRWNIQQQRELQQQVREYIVEQVGLPDVYATGHSSEAHETLVGFYMDSTKQRLAIPMVVEPMHGIPRRLGDQSNNPVLTSLDTLLIDPDSYEHPPLTVGQGRLKVHIPNCTDCLFESPDASGYTTRFLQSDGTVEYNIPVVLSSDGSEYIIDIPAFTGFGLLSINIGI